MKKFHLAMAEEFIHLHMRALMGHIKFIQHHDTVGRTILFYFLYASYTWISVTNTGFYLLIEKPKISNLSFCWKTYTSSLTVITVMIR